MTEITSFQDEYFRENVTENVSHAWYEGDATLHPFEGETKPHYTDFEDDGKYSWVKAPINPVWFSKPGNSN